MAGKKDKGLSAAELSVFCGQVALILEAGLPLIIGGVKIPFEKGFVAHSDGDLLLHAICDALLGAAAIGDIGSHFPDTNPSLKNADSQEPLEVWNGIENVLRVYGATRTHMFGVSIWAKLYRTALINAHNTRFDPSISYEEDCNFIADCFGYVQSAAAVGECLYRYRQMDVSLSKGYRKDTFRFLIHGYGRRCGLLREHGLTDLLPVQESILLLVVKNTSVKISRSDMSRKEKLAEYAEILRYPEVTDAAERANTARSPRLTRMIVDAVRARDPKRLARVMRLWRVADRLTAFKRK